MLFVTLTFLISFAVLLKSADIFTENMEILGKRFNIPYFVLGVTVVAIGTSIPELATSIMAMNSGASEIVLGNVIGSNITNILLVLGVCTLLLKRETEITWDLYHGDITFLIASTIMLGIVIMDGTVTLFEAGMLVLAYLIYTMYNLEIHKRNNGNNVEEEEEEREKIIFNHVNVLQVIVTIILIAVSADYLIKSAIDLATFLNVGSDMIALSLIAIGTSLPELVVSFFAAKRGNIEMAIGNVTGSNIFNALVVVGIPGLMGSLAVTPVLYPETYIYMIISVVIFISIILDKKLHRYEGAVLFLLYLFFLLEIFF